MIELYKDEKINRHRIKYWFYSLYYRIRFHKPLSNEDRINLRMKDIFVDSDGDQDWNE